MLRIATLRPSGCSPRRGRRTKEETPLARTPPVVAPEIFFSHRRVCITRPGRRPEKGRLYFRRLLCSSFLQRRRYSSPAASRIAHVAPATIRQKMFRGRIASIRRRGRPRAATSPDPAGASLGQKSPHDQNAAYDGSLWRQREPEIKLDSRRRS